MTTMTPVSWNASRRADRRLEFRTNWINFFDRGQWKPIDTSLVAMGDKWGCDAVPFKLRLPHVANRPALFVADSQFDLFTKSRSTEPACEMELTPIGVAAVAGNVAPSAPNVLVFKNAYPFGDLIYCVVNKSSPRIEKLVRIVRPPQGADDLRLSFRLRQDAGRMSRAGAALSFRRSDTRAITIRPPQAWDSSGRRIPIELRIDDTPRGMILTKIIPRKFLDQATYPVWTDATFYPNANPETTSVDGYIFYNGGPAVWSTVRAAASGIPADNESAMYVRFTAGTTANQFTQLMRSIILFDTASLVGPVTSATLSLRGTSKVDGNLATPNINIFGASPASNTALVGADFAQTQTTPFSSAISYSSFSTAGFNDFVLNGDGLAAISLTGVSKFSAKNHNYDVANVSPLWVISQQSGFWIQTAESGESTGPKLVVTEAPAGPAPAQRIIVA